MTVFHRTLSLRVALAASSLFAMLALGCEGTKKFTDTEGRTYVGECEDKVCTFQRLAPAGSATANDSQPAPSSIVLRTTGHLIAACDTPKSNLADCRAVTCTDRCPNDPSGNPLTCQRGLCVTSSPTITKQDVLLLCIAGTGTERNAHQAARMALARTCGNPCVVPAECRQP